ncbi:type I-F CRISPR-associated protein Csy2 [Uliginosibacterium sediminicola]|uniref:Type I-F CRISPR-associated protein Csy2 n=1 Tax=Uliginosibacterium sediminicola TaxID=2024550 RepID=A0ABU9Z0P7_9RHOO
MSAQTKVDALLILPHLRIQNANAISSPLTHGFPAMSAFLGLMWALERKLAGAWPLVFDGLGVICHSHEEQTTEGGFTRAFRLTRNPVGKDGSTAAIVEEGRIHLELTLVFGIRGGIIAESDEARQACAVALADTLAQMRVAGGSVLPRQSGWRFQPKIQVFDEKPDDAAKQFRQLRRRWLPGFALVSRDDLLARRLSTLRSTQATATALDAWLDLARFNWRSDVKETLDPDTGEVKKREIVWQNDREGWLVPIPVGYGALSDLHPAGTVANARDATTPFRFVESLYSIGEWLAPHRLQSPQQLLWYADSDAEAGLYRVRNDYAAGLKPATETLSESV